MFLNRRALQAEYFDALDRPMSDVAEGYALLGEINRLFSVSSPFQIHLPQMLGEEACRTLTFLDLGAGDGSLGDTLGRWAAERGWHWRFTNLDLNRQAMRLNPQAKWVIGSALALPFRDQAFDVVIASQMTHHLGTEEQVCRHFSEAWRVTRRVLLVSDLHRNVFLYAIIWMLLRFRRFPKHFRGDALLSVRRSWRVGEWQALAGRAGIPGARVWLYGGARLLLQARREVGAAAVLVHA